RSNFNQFLRQDIWRKSVLAEMRNFDFDQSRRGTEAITEFNSAWSVHIPGAPSSTSALIPLREAIEKTIDELFQRRPIHKDVAGKTKEKIVEIGRSKARRKGIPLAAFQELEFEWYGDKSK